MTDRTASAVAPSAAAPRRAAEWLADAEQDHVAREERRALARASGIRDEETLEGLRRLGLTAETLPALDLAPAVLVGWADGTMSRLERDRLRVLALRRGIGEDHPAWALLQRWMLHRPDAPAEHVLVSALQARLERVPVRTRLKRRAALLDDSEAVARAVGRVLGDPRCAGTSATCWPVSKPAWRAEVRAGRHGRAPARAYVPDDSPGRNRVRHAGAVRSSGSRRSILATRWISDSSLTEIERSVAATWNRHRASASFSS